MACDVFVSHQQNDAPVASALCAYLESRDFKCWLAVRDGAYGERWSRHASREIEECRVFLLLVSSHAMNSPWVIDEAQLAKDSRKHLLPVKLDATPLTSEFKLLIGATNWLPMSTPPAEFDLQRLASAIERLLGRPSAASILERKLKTADELVSAFRFEDALAVLHEAERAFPKRPEVRTRLDSTTKKLTALLNNRDAAAMLTDLRRYCEAIEAWQLVLQLVPTDEQAAQAIVDLSERIRRDDLTAALAELHEAIGGRQWTRARRALTRAHEFAAPGDESPLAEAAEALNALQRVLDVERAEFARAYRARELGAARRAHERLAALEGPSEELARQRKLSAVLEARNAVTEALDARDWRTAKDALRKLEWLAGPSSKEHDDLRAALEKLCEESRAATVRDFDAEVVAKNFDGAQSALDELEELRASADTLGDLRSELDDARRRDRRRRELRALAIQLGVLLVAASVGVFWSLRIAERRVLAAERCIERFDPPFREANELQQWIQYFPDWLAADVKRSARLLRDRAEREKKFVASGGESWIAWRRAHPIAPRAALEDLNVAYDDWQQSLAATPQRESAPPVIESQARRIEVREERPDVAPPPRDAARVPEDSLGAVTSSAQQISSAVSELSQLLVASWRAWRASTAKPASAPAPSAAPRDEPARAPTLVESTLERDRPKELSTPAVSSALAARSESKDPPRARLPSSLRDWDGSAEALDRLRAERPSWTPADTGGLAPAALDEALDVAEHVAEFVANGLQRRTGWGSGMLSLRNAEVEQVLADAAFGRWRIACRELRDAVFAVAYPCADAWPVLDFVDPARLDVDPAKRRCLPARVVHRRTGIELVAILAHDAGFYVAAEPVTRCAWSAGGGATVTGGDDEPLTGMPWSDVVRWCADNGFALPSDEQWTTALELEATDGGSIARGGELQARDALFEWCSDVAHDVFRAPDASERPVRPGKPYEAWRFVRAPGGERRIAPVRDDAERGYLAGVTFRPVLLNGAPAVAAK